jgi:rod shape-determining protein MreC
VRTVETRRRARYVLLVLSLLAVTLITLDSRGVGVFDGIRNVAADVFSPVGDAFAWVTTPVRNAWGGISDYEALEEENERLRARVAELEAGEARAANAQEQLKRIQEQLQIDFVGDVPLQVARVASGPYSNFESFRMEIDKGSDAGLAVGMPVVANAGASGGGLVGRIERVSRTRAVVQLATDPDFGIGIRLASTQDVGFGHGGGDSNRFVIDRGIEIGDPIQPNEVVLTSGLENSVMPPDIPIGTVDKASPNGSTGLQVLLVNYAVDFSQLDVVQVMKWTPPR